MTPPVRWVARLYPAPWRARYGTEFSALLDDVGPGWRDFFDILRGAILMNLKFPGGGKLVAALAAAGLVIAAVVAFRTDDRWVSTAVMQMQPQNSDDRFASLQKLTEAQQEVLSRTSLTRIVMKEDIYRKERTTDPLEDIIAGMRTHSIMIRMVTPADGAYGGPPAFSVAFEYPDRYKARAVTDDLTAALAQQASANLIDPASLPQTPIYPNRAVMIVAGFALGLGAGIIVLGIRRWPAIAACGIVGAALAWAGSQLVRTEYISTAVLTVPDQDTARRISQDLTTRTYLASLIEKMNLYPQERQTKPLEAIIETMRNRAIRIQAINVPQGPPALAISYLSDDSKFTAQAVTRELLARAMGTILPSAPPSAVKVLDPPSLPEAPISPDRPAWIFLGLLTGLLLGITWAVIRHFRTTAAAHA